MNKAIENIMNSYDLKPHECFKLLEVGESCDFIYYFDEYGNLISLDKEKNKRGNYEELGLLASMDCEINIVDNYKFEEYYKECEKILLKYGSRTFFEDKKNYCICHDLYEKEIRVSFIQYMPIQGTIYFKTKESAESALKELKAKNLLGYLFKVM